MSATTLMRQAPCDEDLARASWYALIARLFVAPAAAALLVELASAPVDRGSELGQAYAALAAAATGADEAAVKAEFDALFLGVGRSEMLPYASYHLAGFLHERPLVQLRQWLAAGGLARTEQTVITEDHLAALADTMRYLILAEDPHLSSLEVQRDFFSTFIVPWAERFCESLERSSAASFYRHPACLARSFFAIEQQAFEFLS